MPSEAKRQNEMTAIELMTGWVASIADQVKNPVAAISAALQVFDRELATLRSGGSCDFESIQKVMTQIHTRLHKLDAYVSELSNFAKPAEVFATWEPIEPILNKARVALDKEPGFGGVLTTQVDPRCKEVFVDAEKLLIILNCLLANAYQAAGLGMATRISIIVSPATMTGSNQTAMKISVADNGPGMSEVQIANVDRPFFTTKEAGSGLGLTIVSRYVKAHGGQMIFSQAANLGGAEVSLILPQPNKQSSH